MASFDILTKGNNDIVNITEHVQHAVHQAGKLDGLVNIFLPSTTSAITVMEYEDGALADLRAALERLVPASEDYRHNAKWGDMNGYAHVRAALLKPFMVLPLSNGALALGTWQSIVLIDFDNQPRTRTVHVAVH